MDQRALASGGKILRRNGGGKGRYLVSGRDQRAQPSADGRERSGARRSELHGRPPFCAARRATAAGRSPGGSVDAFSVRFTRRPLILLTDDKSNYVRSRFDAAHELGHLVMHAKADPNDRSIERQAHDFAASFLLPAEVALGELPRRVDSSGW